LFKQRGILLLGGGFAGFNLLSEILFVQALQAQTVSLPASLFQSLERDSVCSSPENAITGLSPLEFQSLERDSVCSSVQARRMVDMGTPVSIS